MTWRKSIAGGFLNVADVRYWHKADMQTVLMDVRFQRNNGHGADLSVCPLMSHSGRLARHILTALEAHISLGGVSSTDCLIG